MRAPMLDIDSERFNESQASQFARLVSDLANGSRQAIGEMKLSELLSAMAVAFPGSMGYAVDALGYAGGTAARATLKRLARQRLDSELGWLTINALNHVQSRTMRDVKFLVDHHNSTKNAMVRIACINGLSARLSDLLHRAMSDKRAKLSESDGKQIAAIARPRQTDTAKLGAARKELRTFLQEERIQRQA